MNMLSDIYAMAYRFARVVNPKLGHDSVDDYARNICSLWLCIAVMFLVVIFGYAFRLRMPFVIFGGRLDIFIIAMVVYAIGGLVVRIGLRQSSELGAPDRVESHYGKLPTARKAVVLCVAGGPLVGILLLATGRQFLGWFGGF